MHCYLHASTHPVASLIVFDHLIICKRQTIRFLLEILVPVVRAQDKTLYRQQTSLCDLQCMPCENAQKYKCKRRLSPIDGPTL